MFDGLSRVTFTVGSNSELWFGILEFSSLFVFVYGKISPMLIFGANFPFGEYSPYSGPFALCERRQLILWSVE